MSHRPAAGASSSKPDAAYRTDLYWSSRRGWRGRSREWEAVAGLLRAAEDSRGGALLVEGQSGIGKSRLIGEAIDAAAARGFVLSHGVADEYGQLAPLSPLMSALGESPRALLTRGAEVRSDAADLRLWLVEQLQDRLEKQAAQGPLLVTLDDLHWADPTTLLALSSLVPELSSYPLVWILSRTIGAGGDDVERSYDVLERHGARRIMLEALDDQAVTDVVTDVLDAVPEPDLLALAAGAEGNPFILVELVEGLRDEGAVEIIDGHARLVARGVPERFQQIARRRLGRLSADTRHLLQVAAILGRSFSVGDLAEMLGEPIGRLLPALEEAESAEVVVPSGDTLRFRHDLLWRAVAETLNTPLRHSLHHQAGDMLLRRGGSALAAAAHLMHYARPGDTRAISGLDQAVREVLTSSPQTAAELAMRALELTDVSDHARFDRTVTAVGALTAAGRLSESAELARGVVSHAPYGQVADLRHQLALILLMNGQPEEAVAEVEDVLAQRDLSGQLRDAVELTWFAALILQKDFWRGRRRAEAIVAARDRHGAGARAGAFVLLLHTAWAEGRVAEGFGHIREAVRISSGRSIGAHTTTPRLFLAACLQCMRQFDEAETVIEAAEEEIEATGHIVQAANLAFVRAYMRLTAGRLDDAIAEAEAGLETAGQLGTHGFVRLGEAVLAIVALLRGDLTAATRHIEHYHAQATGNAIPWGWGTWAAALVAEARDGPGAAHEMLAADTRTMRWSLALEPNLAAWWTRISLAMEDPAHAEKVVETVEWLAQNNPDFPALTNAAAHARGILRGDLASLRYASTRFDDPWARASAAEDLGVLLTRHIDESGHHAAIHNLDQALKGYEQIGAHRDAARARARLRRLGVRRRHWKQSGRLVTGWASLTDTERSVATLVAQGLTNRQVAGQMFISPHTVKFHLGQIFRKLDISSRVELARIVAERRPGTKSPHP